MSMEQGHQKLEQLAKQLRQESKDGNKPRQETLTIRELLSWHGYARRGSYIVGQIKNKMEELELRTIPDFGYGWVDTTIAIELEPDVVGGSTSSESLSDPTVRISALDAANQPLTSVSPNQPLSAATTAMHMNDYSQLPVIEGERNLKGVISWRSVGIRQALGGECKLVSQCMEPAREVMWNTPLLDTIDVIAEHGYVLVKAENRTITGIVTYTDIGEQFMQLAGPYLVLGEIEEHLRRLVHRKFTIEEKRASSNEVNGRRIDGSADMTFGAFCRLLENEEHWGRLNFPVDRVTFIKILEDVKNIRNDVMHFDPDGVPPKSRKKLQELAKFFQDSARIGAH